MIKIEDLHKSFGNLEVLKGISLEVNKGETLAIIGPSGSGKSTLLKCLNLLEVPQKGRVTIGDHYFDCQNLHKKTFLEIRRATAMVFQDFCLFENKKVLDNIVLPLTAVQKKNRAEAVATAERLLTTVGLLEKKDSYPRELSGGQQQRVGIARALALDPEVILFDEPTSALDPELVQEVLDVIKAVAQAHITSIIVTHEMAFARDVADRVAFMDKGIVVELGPAREVIGNPREERTRLFLQRFLNT